MALKTWHQVKIALCDADDAIRTEAINILGSNIQLFRALKKSQIIDGSITTPYKIINKNLNKKPVINNKTNSKVSSDRSHSNTKAIKNLGYFVSRFFDSHVTRELIIHFKPNRNICIVSSNPSTWNDFISVMKDRDDKWWDLLITSTNIEIDEKLKEVERERKAEKKFHDLVKADPFLCNHNIALREISYFGDNHYVAKIYLACGGGFYEGSLNEILECVAEQLEENNIEIKTICPICTGTQIRFDGYIGLCLDCGVIYNVETSEILKKYDITDKERWVSLALVDPVFRNC